MTHINKLFKQGKKSIHRYKNIIRQIEYVIHNYEY